MSKRQGVFTENFTIFFSNAGKTENVPSLGASTTEASLHVYNNFIYVTNFI